MSAANSVFPGATGPEQPAEQGLGPALAAAGELARQAAAGEAGAEYVGGHVGVQPEPSGAATHLFDSELPGYRGWRWAVTVADAGAETEVTVSEVVLLPGPDALVAPVWVPWQQRVRAGDLGVGDLLPPAPDDPRLTPAYVQSDDPEVEQVATELGLGRVHALSRLGRLEAAERWQEGEFGPGSEMARSAPEHCGNCGFYLSLAGSLRAAFGVCGNEISPADGRVVHAEYGCGAHSETEVSQGSPVPVADLVYDDTELDLEPMDTDVAPEAETAVVEPEAEAEPATAEPAGTATALAEAPAEPEPAAVRPEPAVAEPESVHAGAAAEPTAPSAVAEPEPTAVEPERPVALPEDEASVSGAPAAAPVEPEAVGAAPEAVAAEAEDAVAQPEPEAAVAEPGTPELAEPERAVTPAGPEPAAGPAASAQPRAVEPAVTTTDPPGTPVAQAFAPAQAEPAQAEPAQPAWTGNDPITEPIVLPSLSELTADKPEEGQP